MPINVEYWDHPTNPNRATKHQLKRLHKSVCEMMESRGSVSSASGMTAVIAMNWCEHNNRDYIVRGYVQDGKNHHFVSCREEDLRKAGMPPLGTWN